MVVGFVISVALLVLSFVCFFVLYCFDHEYHNDDREVKRERGKNIVFDPTLKTIIEEE